MARVPRAGELPLPAAGWMMSEIPDNHGSPGNREVTLEPDVHYVCQRCTACCKWPGDVRLEEDEILPIAEFLGLADEPAGTLADREGEPRVRHARRERLPHPSGEARAMRRVSLPVEFPRLAAGL